jgi:hypothetical protein
MIILSILIPSIPSRLYRLGPMMENLQAQANACGFGTDVEILSILDNKKRTVGYKRDGLVQLAQGAFLAFVDDDDIPYDNYVKDMVAGVMGAIQGGNDVVVFDEDCTINDGNVFRVSFGLEYPNQEARMVNKKWINITRMPFHSCGWRTSLAKTERFADTSYGEDWDWVRRLVPKARGQYRVNATLLRYVYSDKVTEADTKNAILGGCTE